LPASPELNIVECITTARSFGATRICATSAALRLAAFQTHSCLYGCL
jgi:hypothetical protein